MAGVVLRIGRAIGETMAVVMVAGNQPIIPASIFDGVRTMTANIVLEMGYAADLHRGALIATGVVLFVFILLISMLFNAMKKRGEALMKALASSGLARAKKRGQAPLLMRTLQARSRAA